MDTSTTKSYWMDIVSAFPILSKNKEVCVLYEKQIILFEVKIILLHKI